MVMVFVQVYVYLFVDQGVVDEDGFVVDVCDVVVVVVEVGDGGLEFLYGV